MVCAGLDDGSHLRGVHRTHDSTRPPDESSGPVLDVAGHDLRVGQHTGVTDSVSQHLDHLVLGHGSVSSENLVRGLLRR